MIPFGWSVHMLIYTREARSAYVVVQEGGFIGANALVLSYIFLRTSLGVGGTMAG